MVQFKYFLGSNSQWYWRLQDGNNRIIATSGEGYSSEYNVKRAIDNVISAVVDIARRR